VLSLGPGVDDAVIRLGPPCAHHPEWGLRRTNGERPRWDVPRAFETLREGRQKVRRRLGAPIKLVRGDESGVGSASM
jgi:hypothetical protein